MGLDLLPAETAVHLKKCQTSSLSPAIPPINSRERGDRQ
jgi:hypothetical protein